MKKIINFENKFKLLCIGNNHNDKLKKNNIDNLSYIKSIIKKVDTINKYIFLYDNCDIDELLNSKEIILNFKGWRFKSITFR